MSSDAMLQRLGRRLVEREIHYCVSSLVHALSRREQDGSDGIGPDDLASLAYRQPTADDYREALSYSDEKGRLSVEQGDGVWYYQTRDLDGDVDDEGQGYDDTEAGAWRAGFDSLGMDHPDGSEVYEHWIVSDWLADKLEEQGEAVARDVAGLTIWGRSTTGQAIALDHVIQQIALAAYGEPQPVIPDWSARAFVQKVAAIKLDDMPGAHGADTVAMLVAEAGRIVASARVEG